MEGLDVFIRTYGYPALFGVMVIEQFVPPMPESPCSSAPRPRRDRRLAFVDRGGAALSGTVVADLVWYEIGRRGGQRVLKWMCRLSIEPDTCVRSGEDAFSRWGANALLIAKFLPGLNSIGQPLAGALRMSRPRFVIFDVLGAVLWVGLYVGLGYAFKDQLAEVAALGERLGGWAIAIIAGAFGLYLGVKVTRRQFFLRQLRMARISPEELEAKLTAREPVFVVDLRHELDVQADPMKIQGAIHMVPAALEQGHAAIPRDRDVVLYCS